MKNILFITCFNRYLFGLDWDSYFSNFDLGKLPNNFPRVSSIPEDIDAYLKKESEVSDIYPYAEKTLVYGTIVKKIGQNIRLYSFMDSQLQVISQRIFK